MLVDGGRACINIANIGRKPYIPLSDYVSKIMIEIGLICEVKLFGINPQALEYLRLGEVFKARVIPILRDVHEYNFNFF